ncbi:MAG: hypothetical protein KI785_14320 [Devosiaceae bacterium]|nr:hypothetical protein [Devosiaceae bacterium MH13]
MAFQIPHTGPAAERPAPVPRRPQRPRLVTFLIKHAFIGFTGGVLFVAAMLLFNVGNLATLVIQSDVGVFATALLTFTIGLTFASLQMGFAVMFLVDDVDKGPRGPADTST